MDVGRVRTTQSRPVPAWAVVFGVLLLLAAAAMPEPRAAMEAAMARALAPLQLSLLGAAGAVGTFAGTIGQAGDLAAQNRALREDVRQLQVTLAQMRQLEAENRDLRALLGLRERLPLGNLVPAQVIARDPLSLVQAISIDRGAEDGLAPNMPVVTDQGVVGRVVEVAATTAKVLLLTDVNSGAAVRVQSPDSPANGLVRGTGDGRLILQYVAQDEPIQEGDVLVTSGIGGVFPPGLTVGTITRVSQSDVRVFREALVDPAVKVRTLSRVYIIGKASAPAS